MPGRFSIQKAINVTDHIDRLKKTYMIVSVDAETALEKIQHSLMIKILKIGKKG